ncbi:hypothetical protein QAD02_000190 [Eretmocerus hayati]|uniref:Uncharacterized protein n=1 Tax=Eretmocerus hayati TaxID=131215 RepID=A0ACC2NCW3_9HYME|nr:hypothetical protein QAD02_000190 [Eretmocerus hayati]
MNNTALIRSKVDSDCVDGDPPTSAPTKTGRLRGDRSRDNSSRLATNQVPPEPTPPNPYEHEQLFGKDCGEQMHNIGLGVLCKIEIVKTANRSQNARECSRKLITGVFQLEAVLNCSLNGRKKSDPIGKIPKEKFLSGRAVQAIVSYSQKQAKKRGWPQMTEIDIRRGISKKIWEVKNDFKKLLRRKKIFQYGGVQYEVYVDSA